MIDGVNDRMLQEHGPVAICGEMNGYERALYMEHLLRQQLRANDATVRGFAEGVGALADPVIVDLLEGNEALLEVKNEAE